jgi:opacity protein-like surface antigen
MFAKHKALVLAAALLAAGAAQAQVAVTADAGTTGAGVHLVVPMETYLNGRFGVNAFKHDMTKHSGLVDYDMKGKLQTADILFDWYLREGSLFHLTGGVVYNNNHFDAVGKASGGQFTLNGHTYTAADVAQLNGEVEFRKAAPYLGIGWGNALANTARHWQLSGELGTFFQGDPKVHLVSIGCAAANTVCKAIATDVAAEQLKLQGDLSGYRFYPVARVSLSYRF